MMSGITSPSRPWFKLKIGRTDSTQTSPTSLWLAECERLMMLVFQESNFYNAMAVMYLDLVVFGTAAILIYEDFDNVIRCENPCLGEYYLEQTEGGYPVFYREFTRTIGQVVERWGLENCSASVQGLWRTGQRDGSALSKEIIIGHAIEPNTDPAGFGVPSMFKYRQFYWEVGQSQDLVLERKGYHEAPHICPRWDLVANDAYGRSPGMDALPDIKQLQLETRRKAQALDKMVNPPMIADVSMKNQPASVLPAA
jgi:hypothetical protein